MRVLALSDIHGNIRAVQDLRARESNDFDAVVVAGDFGNDAASEILAILGSFSCPVLYVYGNWDHELEYDRPFDANSVHLHLRSFKVGRISFIGFSGLPTHWGKNPIAEMIRQEVAEKHRDILDRYSEAEAAFARAEVEIEADHASRVAKLALQTKDRRKADYRAKIADLERKRDMRFRKAVRQAERLPGSREYQAYSEELYSRQPEIVARNRRAMTDAINASDADPQQTVVVTHERLTRTAADLSGIPLFLFGHRHGFRDTPFTGSRFVNVSVLDKPITVLPRSGANNTGPGCYRNLNDGNYVVIEGTSLREMRVRCINFDPNLENWEIQPFVIIGEQWATPAMTQ